MYVKVVQRSGVQAIWLTSHALQNFQENNSFSFQLVLSKGQEISLNDKCQALLSAAGTGMLTDLPSAPQHLLSPLVFGEAT